MNCKNCEYGLKQSCGDFEKIICTYEEGECVKIDELEKENAELKKKCYKKAVKDYCELEKEIAELKEQNTNLQEMLKTERSVTCKEEYLKKVAELEAENVELKDDNKVMADNYSKMEQKFYYNLTKAKEILEKLLFVSCNSDVLNQYPNCSEVLQARVEAEQFLKEISE